MLHIAEKTRFVGDNERQQGKAMTNESHDNMFPVVTFEQILDRSALESGITHEELEQEKMIAAIEVRLVAMGRAISDVYAEWETTTAEQIIGRYAHLLEEPVQESREVAPQETDWLDAVYRGLVRKDVYFALFDVSVDRLYAPPLTGQIDVSVTGELLKRIKSLPKGTPTRIRLSPCLNGAELSTALIDIASVGDAPPSPAY
jgi:hypothetical protein